MKKVIIADATIRKKSESSAERSGSSYGFKSVIETAKLLDRAGVDIIEMGPVSARKTDSLILKTVAAAVKAKISVVCGMDMSATAATWEILKSAKAKRLIIALPVSAALMEYSCHKKPAAMLDVISATVSHAASLCDDVEFSAIDASRSDREYLSKAIDAAVSAGASSVTLCDTAGVLMPWEFADLMTEVRKNSSISENVLLGAECSDILGVAVGSVLEAVRCGCDYIKTGTAGTNLPSLLSVSGALAASSDSMASSGVDSTVIRKLSAQISGIWEEGRFRADSDFDDDSSDMLFDSHSDIDAIRSAAESIGYDLSEADMANVFEVFRTVAGKKKVSLKELEAIIASAAMQVPPTYTLDSFVINSGNIITSTAHIVLDKSGRKLAGVSTGDGPIDAAFLAIEQIVGHHFELDDFQIQSVTEGREAVGDAVVKLRSQGRLYSGRGISTDIIGASIAAYISALNKIVYEEHGA